MLNKNKKGLIFIYVILLLNIAVILAIIIVNNSYVFFESVKNQDILQNSTKNIYDNANSIFKLARFYNSNGSGFTDSISCPTSVYMSGATNSGVVSTSINYSSGQLDCSGIYNGLNLNILFNQTYNNFSGAIYDGSYTDLVSGSGLTNFLDSDTTSINFSVTGLNGIDSLDDDFNSDNYSVSSTGNTFYPNNYSDDDTNHRKKLFGYLEPNTLSKNIFFNDSKTNKIISGSLNNNDSINAKISSTYTGYALLDLDGIYDLKIVKFSKALYDNDKLLSPLETLNGKNIPSGYGYLQKSSTGNLSTYYTKTGNEYVFDFVNNYYAIFLTNNTSNVLNYNLSFENITGSGVYIVPIDDTSNDLKFLGNYVLDSGGKYSLSQFYVFGKK